MLQTKGAGSGVMQSELEALQGQVASLTHEKELLIDKINNPNKYAFEVVWSGGCNSVNCYSCSLVPYMLRDDLFTAYPYIYSKGGDNNYACARLRAKQDLAFRLDGNIQILTAGSNTCNGLVVEKGAYPSSMSTIHTVTDYIRSEIPASSKLNSSTYVTTLYPQNLERFYIGKTFTIERIDLSADQDLRFLVKGEWTLSGKVITKLTLL